MRDVLAEICEKKRAHVAACKTTTPLASLARTADQQEPPRGFLEALKAKGAREGFSLICEIKKASPSKGLIREDFDPPALARAYRDGGAACLSVLTDGPYFQGKDGDLVVARLASGLPVLRKDFMLDPYQVVESRALGADCVLLIMAALEDAQAAELESAATELGMDVLVEVHDEAELDRALTLKSPLIGVNNRNLKTLEVDLANGERMAEKLPRDRFFVAESGIYAPEDIDRLRASGARAFLIGESLMRQQDVAAATKALREGAASPEGASA